MTINHDISRVINYIFVAVVFALIFWQVSIFVRNQAIDGCAKNSSYVQEFPSDNAKATYPITDNYEQCLEDKGIK
ncbi:MAG: hypothetical protein HY426_01775 [Candidatus Levybacteria bacterium]|nr:hypothetical protein [Candidatus Levybacteria bacterium]